MLLESFFAMFINERQQHIIKLIETQLNFLLSLVSDVIDLKTIEEFGQL